MTTPIRYVVDTSVFIKHFIPDPLSPKVDQLLGHIGNPQNQFFIPDLFYIECTNTLWKYVRAGHYPAAKVAADLATLKGLPFRVVSTVNLMEDAVSIALAYGISAYDASYVALSQRVGTTLLTLDLRLVRTLTATSYSVLSFNDFEVPPVS
jgi:predicted nucleic acid-binding protein